MLLVGYSKVGPPHNLWKPEAKRGREAVVGAWERDDCRGALPPNMETLLGTKFLVKRDKVAATYFQRQKKLTPKQVRWQGFLADFDWTMEYKPGRTNPEERINWWTGVKAGKRKRRRLFKIKKRRKHPRLECLWDKGCLDWTKQDTHMLSHWAFLPHIPRPHHQTLSPSLARPLLNRNLASLGGISSLLFLFYQLFVTSSSWCQMKQVKKKKSGKQHEYRERDKRRPG